MLSTTEPGSKSFPLYAERYSILSRVCAEAAAGRLKRKFSLVVDAFYRTTLRRRWEANAPIPPIPIARSPTCETAYALTSVSPFKYAGGGIYEIVRSSDQGAYE